MTLFGAFTVPCEPYQGTQANQTIRFRFVWFVVYFIEREVWNTCAAHAPGALGPQCHGHGVISTQECPVC